MICCALVVGALLAIFATIAPFERQPLEQWPYRLSINSLVSFYVVVLKAAMLLVVASGEPALELDFALFQTDRNRCVRLGSVEVGLV